MRRIPMKSDESLEVKTYHKVDVRLLPFLFLCYILAYLDRVNVGFAKLQMLKDLSMSDAAFATGAGIFFIGYFFFEVPSNVLLKKFGARMWIARIMISWGVISACMIFVKGVWSFYALRFLLGLAEAGFFPGVIFYLTLWYPSRLRSSRTAWFDFRLDHGSAHGCDEPGGLAVVVPFRGDPFCYRRLLGDLLSRQQH
jgi:sugar phosphate permease